MTLYAFLGYYLCELHIHSYFVHVMHELFVFSYSVVEWGVIFLLSRFHFETIDAFPCIFTSWYLVVLSRFLVSTFLVSTVIFCCRLRGLLGHLCQFGSLVLYLTDPYF